MFFDGFEPFGNLNKKYSNMKKKVGGLRQGQLNSPISVNEIKTALVLQLKDRMGVQNIRNREHELHQIVWKKFLQLENTHVLANNFPDRLGVYSFYIDDLHFNLGVQLLNDRFGIQVRGGCSCAGTYGHILLNVKEEESSVITDKINIGDLSLKPGWIRMSIHPTMSDEEIHFIMNSIQELSENHENWSHDYIYNNKTNAFVYKDSSFRLTNKYRAKDWFKF